jgi:inosine/xanthosine triphosphate pyrophosphatase family protein
VNLLEDRRARGHRTGAEIITIREATGDDDARDVLGQPVLVPDDLGLDVEVLEGAPSVAVAVRAAKADDRDGHDEPPVGE